MNCLRNTQKKKCMSKEKLWGTPKQTIGDHLPHEKTRTILGYLSIYPCRNSTNFDRPLGPCPCHESSELCYILPERWRDSCTQKIDPNCGCCDAFGFQKRQWGDSPGKLQKFQVSPPQKFDQRFGGYCLPHGLPKQLRPLPWWERLSSLETAETLYV